MHMCTHACAHTHTVYLFTVSASTVKTISPEFTWKITLSTSSSMRPVIIIGSFLISNWIPLVHMALCTQPDPAGLKVKGERLWPG